MLCQHCQKRTANVHFTQVINDSKVEMYLCEQCASEKGKMGYEAPLSINDFFSGFIGFDHANPYTKAQSQNTSCKKCGMSYDEFQRIGKLGCSNCYEVFSDKLAPLVKRLHGNAEHHGKIPHKLSDCIKATREIEKLKVELNKAVHREEYEKAAQLRDKIKKLEAASKC